MSDLAYTPLSDGFKIAQDENGNIVFARNDTTLFVASAADLHTALTPLIGSVGAPASTTQTVVDTTSADALTAANAKIAELTDALGARIKADNEAAAAISAAVAKAQSDAAPSSSEPATIAPSNTGISGS